MNRVSISMIADDLLDDAAGIAARRIAEVGNLIRPIGRGIRRRQFSKGSEVEEAGKLEHCLRSIFAPPIDPSA